MVRFRLIFLALILSLGLGSGLAAQSHLAEGFTGLPAGATVAVMPLDVELFAVTAGGVLEPRAEWTTKAIANLKEALRLRKAGQGGTFVPVPPGDGELLAELNHLHGAVARAIDLHHFGSWKLPSKAGKLDWSLGEEVAEIRKQASADYALFIFLRDSYATGGRVATMVLYAALGVGVGGGAQVGYASLVDLKTGRILWFNEMAKVTGDVRELEPAKATLGHLLKEFPE
ncbi:MAG TPA: hypothetical protein VJ528_13855 [Geothrix sp.]|uniref:hypothetical protein n=1 Tax=Geothrix mesophila TaxID=2922723 RepID=UPI001FACA5FE|nr:hypothetical protein [Geothrix sp. SG198]HJV39920.1 hypothetical protein [Geothrix sp.]